MRSWGFAFRVLSLCSDQSRVLTSLSILAEIDGSELGSELGRHRPTPKRLTRGVKRGETGLSLDLGQTHRQIVRYERTIPVSSPHIPHSVESFFRFGFG